MPPMNGVQNSTSDTVLSPTELIHQQLSQRGIPLTAQNIRRMLESNARGDVGEFDVKDVPGLINQAPPGADPRRAGGGGQRLPIPPLPGSATTVTSPGDTPETKTSPNNIGSSDSDNPGAIPGVSNTTSAQPQKGNAQLPGDTDEFGRVSPQAGGGMSIGDLGALIAAGTPIAAAAEAARRMRGLPDAPRVGPVASAVPNVIQPPVNPNPLPELPPARQIIEPNPNPLPDLPPARNPGTPDAVRGPVAPPATPQITATMQEPIRPTANVTGMTGPAPTPVRSAGVQGAPYTSPAPIRVSPNILPGDLGMTRSRALETDPYQLGRIGQAAGSAGPEMRGAPPAEDLRALGRRVGRGLQRLVR